MHVITSIYNNIRERDSMNRIDIVRHARIRSPTPELLSSRDMISIIGIAKGKRLFFARYRFGVNLPTGECKTYLQNNI